MLTEGGNDPKKKRTEESPDLNEAALVSINPEYQFWLSVPGTEIDYPVVRHEDNEYYLNHNFYQEQHISGCVFADSSAVPLAVDNTVLYGHNMKDGSMFADLKKYGEEAFFRENPVIQIFYRGKWVECPCFSCQLRHQSDAGAYGTNFMEEEWLPYLEKMGATSLYETGIIPEGDEKLITLSTCYGKDQYLIVAGAAAWYVIRIVVFLEVDSPYFSGFLSGCDLAVGIAPVWLMGRVKQKVNAALAVMYIAYKAEK